MQENKNTIIIILLVIVILVLAYFVITKPKQVKEEREENNQQPTINNLQENDNLNILGNKDDLISFSVSAGSKVFGIVKVFGEIRGGYFFEGNMPIAILDTSKKVLKGFPSQAITEWMTANPVSFSSTLDFTGLPPGPAYIALTQDDPSGGESGRVLRQVLIPIIIENNISSSNTSTTYIYKNHGFTIELPKGYVPQENASEGGPMITITLPNGWITYITNASWWEQYNLPEFVYVKDIQYGSTTFKMYKHKYPEAGDDFYYFRQGNVAYAIYNGGTTFFETLKTFKFVGWAQ